MLVAQTDVQHSGGCPAGNNQVMGLADGLGYLESGEAGELWVGCPCLDV